MRHRVRSQNLGVRDRYSERNTMRCQCNKIGLEAGIVGECVGTIRQAREALERRTLRPV